MKTILIVDDDIDDIEFLMDAIYGIDATTQCISAFDGEQALQRLADDHQLNPDYIFLDLNMPKMSGKECLRRIKEIPRFANIPVIIYSTTKIKEGIMESLNMERTYFMTKPAKLSVLKHNVLNIFEGKWEFVRS